MACCSPLGEVATDTVEEENMDKAVIAAEVERALGENPIASDGEKRPMSPNTEDTLSEGGSDNENSRPYYFGSSTITVGKIKEIEEKDYFLEGEARAPGAETMPELDNDKGMVYEDFFVAGLRMPPHPLQLHQLMPNAIAQLSKYF
jgi:hypothetical protein